MAHSDRGGGLVLSSTFLVRSEPSDPKFHPAVMRPSFVALVAGHQNGPAPWGVIRRALMPFCADALSTAADRASPSVTLLPTVPTLSICPTTHPFPAGFPWSGLTTSFN